MPFSLYKQPPHCVPSTWVSVFHIDNHPNEDTSVEHTQLLVMCSKSRSDCTETSCEEGPISTSASTWTKTTFSEAKGLTPQKAAQFLK